EIELAETPNYLDEVTHRRPFDTLQIDSGSEGSWFDPRRGNYKRRCHLFDGGVCAFCADGQGS
uniref:hypothetical protein n=1 Tax=Gemmatimonas sp. TaxID=1962908 RepID=UPI0033420D94